MEINVGSQTIKISSGGNNSIIINGTALADIDVDNINITQVNGRVIINGKDITEQYSEQQINIVVNGDVQTIASENATVVVNGNIGGDITSLNGNIQCVDISGNCESKNGNIAARNINGSVNTKNGNIY